MILRSVLASRTRTTASDATSAGHVACETQRGRLDLAPHGALGGFAQATAALVARAPTSSSGVGRLGDGACSDIGRRGEAVCVEEGIPIAVGVGRDVWNAGSLRGLRWCRSLRSFTRRPRSARSCSRRARDTGEAQLSGRDWWATLDGQSRDQSRLSEGDGSTRDRDGAGAAPRSTLRQRHRRARPGAGPGGSCRGDCCARQGRCRLTARQLPKGRGGRSRVRCGGCGGCVQASGGGSAAQDPGDADRNGVLELRKHGELGCKRAQITTARHGATKSTAKGTKKEGEAALTKVATDAVRQGAPRPSS